MICQFRPEMIQNLGLDPSFTKISFFALRDKFNKTEFGLGPSSTKISFAALRDKFN